MLVFVAGGSGAIGRPLVSRLARAGHNVVATTRATRSSLMVAA
jgi:nucleoside-diphosphate-sugar epimerase